MEKSLPSTLVPDHPTAGRWCKGCQAFLPLNNFAPGKRRFTCKLHGWPRAKVVRDRMFQSAPHKKALWRVWHYAYLDSRALFSGARALTQHDIQGLCDETGLAPSEELRVVPVNPTRPAEGGNIAFVRRQDRTLLAKIWRHTSDVGMYGTALGRVRLTAAGGEE